MNERGLQTVITSMKRSMASYLENVNDAKTNKDKDKWNTKYLAYGTLLEQLEPLVAPVPDLDNVELPAELVTLMLKNAKQKLANLQEKYDKSKKELFDSFSHQLNWNAEFIIQTEIHIHYATSLVNYLEEEPNRVVRLLTHFVESNVTNLLIHKPYQESTNQVSNMMFLWKQTALRDIMKQYLNELQEIDRKIKTTFHDDCLLKSLKFLF